MSPSTTLTETLTTAASHIRRRLADSDDPALASAVDDWCDRQGLDRLDTSAEIVARQAAFNVLLKATLYEQYHQQDSVADLGDDPQAAFERAYDETDDPAFGTYVLDTVGSLADTQTLTAVAAARHDLLAVDQPAETVGRLFESLTPQDARRKLGQFRTPPAIASLMAAWLIEDGTETVLDPGMGAGALAAAAYERKQQVGDSPPVADIHGVDLNELAVVMAGTSLALLNGGEPHNLSVGDFLAFDSADTDAVDAIVSNPPYSRHHELDGEYKQRINAQAEREASGTVSALSPMYAYFYFHAAEFLAPGGRLSFITPSEFLETSYGESLKRFLVETFDIRALVLFDRDGDSKFEEALTTSLVSFLEKPDAGREALSEPTRIIRVDSDPSESELLEAIEGHEDDPDDPEWGTVSVISQDELDPADKWTTLFDPLEIETDDLVALSEFASVTRGIATGQNDYFCLTQKQVAEWELDESYLAPIIRTARSVPGYEYTAADWQADREAGRAVWVLYHLTELDAETVSRLQPTKTEDNRTLAAYSEPADDDSVSESTDDARGIVDYLQYGLTDEVAAHSGYLARHRTPWYVVDRRDPPPVVVTYMSRGGSRFILNETDARTLSNLHGLYFDVELTATEQKALLAYLNSRFASEVVRRSGRTYASGMDKIEPNELEGIPVLDPRTLDDETTRELADRFDRLRRAGRTDTDVETAIDSIDDYLQQIR